MRHKGARAYEEKRRRGEDEKEKEDEKPRKKDTMQIAMETAAGSPR